MLGSALAFLSGAAVVRRRGALDALADARHRSPRSTPSTLMLLAVLLGIAVGSLVYTRWRTRIGSPLRVLGLLFAGRRVCWCWRGSGRSAGCRSPGWRSSAGCRCPSLRSRPRRSCSACWCCCPVTALLGVSFPLLLHLCRSAARGTAQRDAAGSTPGTPPAPSRVRSARTCGWCRRSGCSAPYLVFAVAAARAAAASALRPRVASERRRRRSPAPPPSLVIASFAVPALEAVGPGAHVRRASTATACSGATVLAPPRPRRLAARAALAGLLPRGRRGGRGRLGAAGEPPAASCR